MVSEVAALQIKAENSVYYKLRYGEKSVIRLNLINI